MAINSDNRSAWQDLADHLAPNRPDKGRRVRIERGKYQGKIGLVTWHGPDKFANTRYKSEAQLHLRDMAGREGFRIRVQPDEGGQAFFTNAEYATVLRDTPAKKDPDWLDQAEAEVDRKLAALSCGGSWTPTENSLAEADNSALRALLADEAERDAADPYRDDRPDAGGTTTYYDDQGEPTAIYVDGWGRIA
jgi:hypothetical protein